MVQVASVALASSTKVSKNSKFQVPTTSLPQRTAPPEMAFGPTATVPAQVVPLPSATVPTTPPGLVRATAASLCQVPLPELVMSPEKTMSPTVKAGPA